jgi:tyrosinase
VFVKSNVLQQVVVQHAIDAANEFSGSDRDRYLAAAQNLRIPYWDWARPVSNGQHVAPDSVTSPGISVNLPSGPATIANPLYSYRFRPVDQRLGGPVSTTLGTS